MRRLLFATTLLLSFSCAALEPTADSQLQRPLALCQDKTSNRPVPNPQWIRCGTAVLRAGGAADDGRLNIATADPDVLIDPQTGTVRLWLQIGRAGSFSGEDYDMIIAHGESTDGGFSFEFDAQPALGLPADEQAWDRYWTETPSVVIDPDDIPSRRYKLYYSGARDLHSDGYPNYAIGLAYSADGRNFVRLPAAESPYGEAGLVLKVQDALPDVAGLAGGVVADPEVQWVAGVYHLWFSAAAQNSSGEFLAFGISHATSADGVFWIPSPDNPVPSLRNSIGIGGQQPSVTYDAHHDQWTMYFTRDGDDELEQMPSTFNPSLGVWSATSTDALVWTTDDKHARDFAWDGAWPDEAFGLLTGADVLWTSTQTHLYYTGWGRVAVPEGFVVPVRDDREYVPAVLNLLHATKLTN